MKLASALAISLLSIPAAAQPVLEPPPPVSFWAGTGQVVDYSLLDLTGCSAYWYRIPGDEYSEWQAWAGAVDLKLLGVEQAKSFMSAVYDKDFGKALTHRTLPVTDERIANLKKSCSARLVRPAPIWKVASGLGARNGTRPMFAVAAASGVPTLGDKITERATVGDRCWCGIPETRVLLGKQTYCQPYRIKAVTICVKG